MLYLGFKPVHAGLWALTIPLSFLALSLSIYFNTECYFFLTKFINIFFLSLSLSLPLSFLFYMKYYFFLSYHIIQSFFLLLALSFLFKMECYFFLSFVQHFIIIFSPSSSSIFFLLYHLSRSVNFFISLARSFQKLSLAKDDNNMLLNMYETTRSTILGQFEL